MHLLSSITCYWTSRDHVAICHLISCFVDIKLTVKIFSAIGYVWMATVSVSSLGGKTSPINAKFQFTEKKLFKTRLVAVFTSSCHPGYKATLIEVPAC